MSKQELIKAFRLKPVRKFLSTKVKYESGIPESVLICAKGIGFISEIELQVLMALKIGTSIELSEDKLMDTLNKLTKKDLLMRA